MEAGDNRFKTTPIYKPGKGYKIKDELILKNENNNSTAKVKVTHLVNVVMELLKVTMMKKVLVIKQDK